jgi:hypothetical protein
MRAGKAAFTSAFRNEPGRSKLSPDHPQVFVDILWKKSAVGTLQRQEIEQ